MECLFYILILCVLNVLLLYDIVHGCAEDLQSECVRCQNALNDFNKIFLLIHLSKC